MTIPISQGIAAAQPLINLELPSTIKMDTHNFDVIKSMGGGGNISDSQHSDLIPGVYEGGLGMCPGLDSVHVGHVSGLRVLELGW